MYRVLPSSLNIFKYINNQHKEQEFFDKASTAEMYSEEGRGRQVTRRIEEHFKRIVKKIAWVYALKYVTILGDLQD